MNLNKVIFKFVRISFSVLVVLLVIYGLTKLGTTCYDFGYRVFTEEAMAVAPGKDVTVQVTSDMSEYEIGKMLKEKGLVEDAKLFYVQLKISSYSGKLQQGVYVLNTSMTPSEMMAAMAVEKEEDTEEVTEEASESTVTESTEVETETEAEAEE